MPDAGRGDLGLDARIDRWRKRQQRISSLTPRELDELEDHLRARVGLLLETDAALGPGRAFTVARDELGKSTALSKEFANSGNPRWRKLLLAGWVVYAASFLLPVTTGAVNRPWGWEAATLWGWQAFLGALLMSTDWLMKLSAVSNFLVLATCLKLRGKRPPRSIWLRWGLTGAALLNLYWVTADVGLMVGYWVWVASFACVAAALWMRAAAWASAIPQATARAAGQGAFE